MARENDEDAADHLDELARIWPRIAPDADTTLPECDAATLNRLADTAQASGHTHPVIAYARAIARLRERVRTIIEHPDNPFDQAGLMPLLSVVTNDDDEYEFIHDHAQMMMQGDEGPCVTFHAIDNIPWALLCDVLGAYYAQALAFEALPEYGLCDPYNDKETDHD